MMAATGPSAARSAAPGVSLLGSPGGAPSLRVQLSQDRARKRAQKLARTKSALNAVLCIRHLNRRVKAKKQGAGVIAEFLVSIAQQSLLPISVRVFM